MKPVRTGRAARPPQDTRKEPRRTVIEPAERHRAVVDDLAPGGDGVLHVTRAPSGERRAVFVRGVARGEEVVVDVDFSARPPRGRLLEVVTASAERVVPACPDAGRCGGCDWMHLSTSAQREGHLDHVRRALSAAVPAAFPIGYTPAPSPLAYRTRTRLHAHASGGRAVVAMRAAGGHEPVEIERCVVVAPALDGARATLARLLDGAHGEGDAQLALGAGGAAVVDLRWSATLPPSTFARAESAVAAGRLAGLRLWTRGVDRPAVIGDPSPVTLAADGAPLHLGAGGFAQAAEAMNAALGARVAELAGRGSGIELYAGAGNLTVLLARTLAPLVSVEADANACTAARENLRARGLVAKVVEADASSYPVARATDVVVLDPPRTGARQACVALGARPPKRIVYVSCDPPTLGRDLALLVTGAPGGMTVRSVDVFEMFPQTSHVETVVCLVRG